MVVRTDSSEFESIIRLRLPLLTRAAVLPYWPTRTLTTNMCTKPAEGLHGWHLSDFFTTRMLVQKLQSYNRNDDVSVQKLLRLPKTVINGIIEHRVRHCSIDVRDPRSKMLRPKLNIT